MKTVRSLGYRTDCIVREFDGTVVEKDRYYVVRMDSNPTFHWGNLLLFKQAPKEGDLQVWMDAHVEEFGPDSGHVTFGWDSQEEGCTQEFRENRFCVSMESVLRFGELQSITERLSELEVRRIVSDDDWRSVVELQTLVGEGAKPSAGYVEFKRNLFRTYRKMSVAGRGDWWGAFSGTTLLGDMGLYFDETLSVGRFQSVETHPDHRRKGVCHALLHALVRHALESVGTSNLVICTETDSEAARVYRSVGFKHCEYQRGVSLPCSYAKRFEQRGTR